jgi:hypothetical protein
MNRYEIRVVGHLDARRARTLACEECRWLPDGDSILVVAAIDQAAMYGLLARLRDAALELVDVRRVEPPTGNDRVGDRAGRREGHPR